MPLARLHLLLWNVQVASSLHLIYSGGVPLFLNGYWICPHRPSPSHCIWKNFCVYSFWLLFKSQGCWKLVPELVIATISQKSIVYHYLYDGLDSYCPNSHFILKSYLILSPSYRSENWGFRKVKLLARYYLPSVEWEPCLSNSSGSLFNTLLLSPSQSQSSKNKINFR